MTLNQHLDEHAESPAPPARSRRRWWLLAITAVLMAAVAAWVTSSWSDPQSIGRAAGDAVIQEYPVDERVDLKDFEGTLLDGERFASADLEGKVAVYNVWGSWCVPCRTEAPELIRVAEEFVDDVSFVGINVRDSLAAARAFERRQEVPYPSIRADDSGEALLAFGSSVAVAAVPTSVVVDRDGKIAARVVGPTTYGTLKALVAEVVGEDGVSISERSNSRRR